MTREWTRTTGVAAAALVSLASCTVYDDSLLTRASAAQRRADDAGATDRAADGASAEAEAQAGAGGEPAAGSGGGRERPDRDMSSERSASCSDCCTEQRIAGNAYYFCTRANTWDNALERCKSEFGAGLARIADGTQARLLAEQANARVWIGHHARRDSLWAWSDNGVPFWHGEADGKPVFDRGADWADGQPEQGKQCGELTPEAELASDDCSDPKPYICQKYPDACPDDDAKTDPGQCGCGVEDVDRDDDGFASCNDACEDDADKPLLRVCDCGPEQDDDGDGTVNCNDGCPTDAKKTAAGACGCGKPDSDQDRDGVADCQDRCANDPQKQAPGQCGCGTSDNDQDRDGTADCRDGCPRDANTTGNCFPFATSNLDPKVLEFTNAPATRLNCGATTLDTSPSPARFTNWCGTAPRPVVRKLNNGPEVVVIPLRGLEIDANATLRLIGSRPVVFAVRGDVTVSGVIDASASGATPGAGGNWSCGSSQGGAGQGRSGADGGGGGGGGFGTAGGPGGDDIGDGAPGAAGAFRGTGNLAPLLGGCGGGAAGGCAGVPGAGGGAVQITASGKLAVSGAIRANGANGADACDDDAGGQGGGSGGAILLESPGTTRTGALTANGGNGGAGDRGNPGQGATASNANGREGSNGGGNGGGGGGGGYGRIVVR